MNREYRCGWRQPGGAICRLTFKRKWNLKRHQDQQHGLADRQQGAVFVNNTVGDVHRAGASLLPSIAAPASIPVPNSAPAQMSPDITILPRIAPSLTVTSVPGMAPNSFAGLPDGLPISSPAHSPPAQSSLLTSPPRSPINMDSPEGRRYWTEREYFQEVLPKYDVKLSKSANQQKGVQWLTYAGKSSFDAWIGGLMASWGLSSSVGSCSICITCPADWVHLEAGDVASNLHQGNSPMYTYSDHTTTAARAAAWFGRWPRRGIELDNLIECGPFQRMDGSHCCHNAFCILPSHIVYEPVAVNKSRAECSKHARFLRVHGRAVPPACDKHEPPCLMQHAVLTMYERCLLQVLMFRMFCNIELPPPPRRPRLHPFPSFDPELPLRFVGAQQGVVVRLGDRAPGVPHRGTHKPGLVCSLCLSARIKGFASVVALWGHVVHRHKDQSNRERLREVRRAAALWKQYLDAELVLDHTRGYGSTPYRIAQLDSPACRWADVEQWGLRG
ncbi:hypothetical protein LQW54_005791 [Pestalotiopsis sp. IQ-011]